MLFKMSFYLSDCSCLVFFFRCHFSLSLLIVESSRLSHWFSFLGTVILLEISSSDKALNINHVLQTPQFKSLARTSLLNSSQICQNAHSTSSNDGKQTSHLYISTCLKLMLLPCFHFPIPLVFQFHNLEVILDPFYSLELHIQFISKSSLTSN